jgi:hypothetical protein
MKNFLNIFLTSLCALVLCCCSGQREFRIDVTSDDLGTQNISIIYYANGAYNCETVSAIDGKFTINGMLADPTLVELFTANGAPLGSLIVDGGDDIEAHLSVMAPENMTIKGNKDSELLVEFLNDNQQALKTNNADALNRAVEAFIRENPKRFLSIVLLTRYFTVEGYEKLALELFQQIPDKYRRPDFTAYFEQLLSTALASDTLTIGNIRTFSPGDSAFIFKPAGAKLNLLMLTDNDSRTTDSVKAMLTAIRGGAPTKEMLRITDFGCDRDTLVWHSSLRNIGNIENYPSDVDHLWLVAGAASDGIFQTAPSSIPYFILTDSTGRMLYRGASVAATKAAFGRYRKKL